MLKECVKKGIEPPRKLNKQEKEIYDRLKREEEDRNK
jgi:sRNA-binding carbon storage regulator CsrA